MENNSLNCSKFLQLFLKKNHFCRVENCQRVFKKRPNRSVRGKLEFLQSLGKVSSKELETFLASTEQDSINDEFHWIE